MKRILLAVILTLGLGVAPTPLHAEGEKKARYVFYFIGDGMGFTSVALTEYYNGYANHLWGAVPLSFTTFPILGTATTFSESNLITDSAAAGSALATGEKTSNETISMSSDSSRELKSIATVAKEKGFKVGITSTVGLNHATPAAFYAHNSDRHNYYEIALDICDSGFDLFAGGGLIDHDGTNGDRRSAFEIISESGYSIAEGMEEFLKIRDKGQKIFLIQEEGDEKECLPYAIDAEEDDLSHADLVKASIACLYEEERSDKGFFIMSEGGKIDWACHANDAKSAVLEIMSMAEAVEVALEFYRQHPEETLIVVTADHETGGLAMGDESGYNLYFEKLKGQKSSKYMPANNSGAKIGWTTKDHTGANVPIYAIGAGSELFGGRMDNTDIPKRICEAMGISLK